MSNDKKNPTKIDADFSAKPTEELEKAIAEDLQAEDPEDAEEVIASLEIVEEVEDEDEDEEEEDDDEEATAVEEDAAPITRHRGSKPDGSA